MKTLQQKAIMRHTKTKIIAKHFFERSDYYLQERKSPKKPLIFYYTIALFVLIILNTFVFPSMIGRQVKQVDYNTFLNDLSAGKVKEVALTNNQITFSELEADGKEQLYKTGIFPDDTLVDKLHAANVTFAAEIPVQNSPLLDFLLQN